VLPEPPEYVAFLAPYPATTQALARELRHRLVALLPDCIESVWDATNATGVAYGFTEKTSDHFIHLPVYARYVNIGFPRGVYLTDPEVRLKGTGVRTRHVRLDRPEDLDDPYLVGLIREAVELADGFPVPPRSVIREMAGPRRRPSGAG